VVIVAAMDLKHLHFGVEEQVSEGGWSVENVCCHMYKYAVFVTVFSLMMLRSYHQSGVY